MPENKCNYILKPLRGITLIAPPVKAWYDVESTKLISFFSPARKVAFNPSFGKIVLKKVTCQSSSLQQIQSH